MELYPTHGLIHSTWRIGLNEFGHALYGWRGMTLMLLSEEIENIPPWDTPEGWYVVTRWLHNGSMQEEETQTTQHRCYHEGLCPLLKHLE